MKDRKALFQLTNGGDATLADALADIGQRLSD
jgi:hypothetical protein